MQCTHSPHAHTYTQHNAMHTQSTCTCTHSTHAMHTQFTHAHTVHMQCTQSSQHTHVHTAHVHAHTAHTHAHKHMQCARNAYMCKPCDAHTTHTHMHTSTHARTHRSHTFTHAHTALMHTCTHLHTSLEVRLRIKPWRRYGRNTQPQLYPHYVTLPTHHVSERLSQLSPSHPRKAEGASGMSSVPGCLNG